MSRVHHVLVRMHVLEGGLPNIPPHIIQHSKIILLEGEGQSAVYGTCGCGQVHLEVKDCKL